MLKPALGVEEICELFDVGRTKAFEIKRKALAKHNGFTIVSKVKARTDSVFEALGLSRKDELNLLISAMKIENERSGING